MSLLAQGPHTVQVYPEEVTEDFHGNVVKRPSTTAVTIAGAMMQPLNSDTDVSEGQRVSVTYRLIAQSAPVGPWARVVWVDSEGVTRSFAVIGQPSTRRFTRATSHTTATLREER